MKKYRLYFWLNFYVEVKNILLIFLLETLLSRWLTRDFRSDGRLSIGSTGHKNLYIALGLGGSGLDAKGGIVGGNIEIAHINTYSKYISMYSIIVYNL